MYKVGIKDLPFTLLAIDLVWWVLSFFGLYSSDFWWMAEVTGHSLAFEFYAGYYAIRHKQCLYTWVCIAGLALLNFLNLVHYFFDLAYIQAYAGMIIITSLAFAIIKWRQHYYKS